MRLIFEIIGAAVLGAWLGGATVYILMNDPFDKEPIAVGSAMTGSAWFINTSQEIQSAVASWGLRVPSLASSGDCVVTDASGVFSTSACGSGGGGSGLFTYNSGTDTISPIIASTSNTARLSVSSFHATSTATSSTFNNASTTLLSGTTAWFTTFFGSLDGQDGNVTNIGNINLDSLTPDSTSGGISIKNNAGTNLITIGAGSSASTNIGVSGNISSSLHAAFTDYLQVNGNSSNAGRIRVGEDTDNGSSYAELIAPSSIAANYVVNMPSSAGTLALTSELHNAVTLAGQDYLSLATQQITANAINPDNLAATDFGDWTCNGTVCSLDTGVVATDEILNNTIIEPDLNVDDTPADGDILTYDSTGTNFVWETILDLINLITGAVNWGGITSFEIPNGANPTVDATGEIAFNTSLNSLSIATSTTGAELPIYDISRFAYATSSWSGTTTRVGNVTTPNFNERITTGTCYADGSGIIRVGDGTNWSNGVSLASGTTTVTFTSNNYFNKNGERWVYEIGTPTTLTEVQCSFELRYER